MNRFVRPFPEKKKTRKKRPGMCSQLNASYLQYRARNENEKNIENIELVAKRENRPARTTDRQSFGNGRMPSNVAALRSSLWAISSFFRGQFGTSAISECFMTDNSIEVSSLLLSRSLKPAIREF